MPRLRAHFATAFNCCAYRCHVFAVSVLGNPTTAVAASSVSLANESLQPPGLPRLFSSRPYPGARLLRRVPARHVPGSLRESRRVDDGVLLGVTAFGFPFGEWIIVGGCRSGREVGEQPPDDQGGRVRRDDGDRQLSSLAHREGELVSVVLRKAAGLDPAARDVHRAWMIVPVRR